LLRGDCLLLRFLFGCFYSCLIGVYLYACFFIVFPGSLFLGRLYTGGTACFTFLLNLLVVRMGKKDLLFFNRDFGVPPVDLDLRTYGFPYIFLA